MMISGSMNCAANGVCSNIYGTLARPKEASVFCLPEEVWEKIALNLSAEDLLSLLCVNRWFHTGLGKSTNVWRMLSHRDGASCYEELKTTKQFPTLRESFDDDEDEKNDWRKEKLMYLFRCHKTNPSESGGGVHWYPVRPYGRFAGISDREGHISCVLSRHAISDPKFDSRTLSIAGNMEHRLKLRERIVVVTGGFASDDSIYFIHAGTGVSTQGNPSVSGNRRNWGMERVDPIGRPPSFVYGASLTALPTLYDYSETTEPHKLTATMRAIRFGGFRAGGYSNETSQVVLLTVKQDANRVEKRQRKRRGKRDKQHSNDENSEGDDEESWSTTWEWHWNRPLEVSWSKITTTGIPPGGSDEENSLERDILSRAYHTATLLLDRYLVVIGGMKSTNSVLNESVLDTKTWKWIGNGHVACGSDGMDSRPSGRHGHSIILDDSRNRLVLFGGGSGSDLLRSGTDNSEVWELQLGEHWRDTESFEESFPWKWKKLHEDSNENNESNSVDTMLTPSQTLCLGRCHNGIKISRDTALFLFGSGRPSTNGLLAYDLKKDNFFQQPQFQQQLNSSGAVHVEGILPKPRFTGVAAFLEEDGYIITHGGYCSQDHDTIGTIDVLDLAPGFRGRLNPLSKFDGLSIDERRVSYGEVTDSQAERGRQDPNAAMQGMLQTLANTPSAERPAIARGMLNEMTRGQRPWNEQTLLFMTMIANGSPIFLGHDEDDSNSDIMDSE